MTTPFWNSTLFPFRQKFDRLGQNVGYRVETPLGYDFPGIHRVKLRCDFGFTPAGAAELPDHARPQRDVRPFCKCRMFSNGEHFSRLLKSPNITRLMNTMRMYRPRDRLQVCRLGKTTPRQTRTNVGFTSDGWNAVRSEGRPLNGAVGRLESELFSHFHPFASPEAKGRRNEPVPRPLREDRRLKVNLWQLIRLPFLGF